MVRVLCPSDLRRPSVRSCARVVVCVGGARPCVHVCRCAVVVGRGCAHVYARVRAGCGPWRRSAQRVAERRAGNTRAAPQGAARSGLERAARRRDCSVTRWHSHERDSVSACGMRIPVSALSHVFSVCQMLISKTMYHRLIWLMGTLRQTQNRWRCGLAWARHIKDKRRPRRKGR